MSYFYSHLVSLETVYEALDGLKMDSKQRKHLAQIVDSNIHQEVLDIILSNLSGEDKILFMERLRSNPEDKEIMEMLKSKILNIEGEIKKTIDKISKELHEDIAEAKGGIAK